MTASPALLRLACALGITLLFVGLYFLVRALVLTRAGRSSRELERFKRGAPGIVYFTTPDCLTCKAAQRPALRALEQRLAGAVQVIEVNALEQPDLARAWAVLSVPTTFVLDGDGKPREVNHGFASTEKLLAQLERVRSGS